MDFTEEFYDINFSTCFLTIQGDPTEISRFRLATEDKAKRTRKSLYHCADNVRIPFERYLSPAFRCYTPDIGYEQAISSRLQSVGPMENSETRAYIFGIEDWGHSENSMMFRFKTLNYWPMNQVRSMAERFDLEFSFSYFGESSHEAGWIFYKDRICDSKLHFTQGEYDSVINLFHDAGVNVYDKNPDQFIHCNVQEDLFEVYTSDKCVDVKFLLDTSRRNWTVSARN